MTSHVNVVEDTLQHTVRGLAVVLGNLHRPVTSLITAADESYHENNKRQLDSSCLLVSKILYPNSLPVQVELERDGWGTWTCFGVRVRRTLDYPTIKLNPR